MYVIDLMGRLGSSLSGLRYLSVFKYYGNAIEDGIEPLAFVGVTLAACVLAAIGAWLFERRDLAAEVRGAKLRRSDRPRSSTAQARRASAAAASWISARAPASLTDSTTGGTSAPSLFCPTIRCSSLPA